MKKKLPLFFLICLIIILVFNQYFKTISQSVLADFALNIIPSLAPSMLFDYLFINTDGLSYIYQLLSKKVKNTHAIYRHLLVFLGLISGTPTLANYLEDSLQKNYLQKEEGEAILSAFALPSFPFIMSFIIPELTDEYRLIFIIIFYLPPLIYYLLMTKKYTHTSLVSFTNYHQNFLEKSIIDTSKTFLLLLGSVLIFSLPLLLINYFPNNLIRFSLASLFEFTNIRFLISLKTPISFLLSIIVLSFSSLSLFCQIAILAPSFSLKSIIKKRLLLCGVTSLLALSILFI